MTPGPPPDDTGYPIVASCWCGPQPDTRAHPHKRTTRCGQHHTSPAPTGARSPALVDTGRCWCGYATIAPGSTSADHNGVRHRRTDQCYIPDPNHPRTVSP